MHLPTNKGHRTNVVLMLAVPNVQPTLNQHWVNDPCLLGEMKGEMPWLRNVPREDRLCICKKSVEDPIHFILNCERYKDYRDLFVKNMTNLNMKIEKNYPNKIIQLLFNFEVRAEVSRHCLNFEKIFMHHEVRCKNYGFTVNNYISTLLYLAMISV